VDVLMLIRQLVSIAILPVTVTFVIPWWIASRNGLSVVAPRTAADAAAVAAGAAFLAVGVVLFAWSLFYFWTRGRGTLAPWDPPRAFVVEGPYRYVRNPMISGVIFILMGEAFVMRAQTIAEWAALFTLINVIYIPLTEEPMLAARFGEPYAVYKRAVRRFLPRIHAWRPDAKA
jgi:protein-S-isoprenylcysteine O-methyltransferase Ste14